MRGKGFLIVSITLGVALVFVIVAAISVIGFVAGQGSGAARNFQIMPFPTQPNLPTPSVTLNTESVQPEPNVKSDEPPRFFKSASELAESAVGGQPDISIADLETNTHNLVNAERIARNLAPLVWDSEIAVIARKHSEDMAANGYFSHDNLRGQKAADRGNEAGYECIKVYEDHYTFGLSENLFQGWLYSSVATINGVEFPNWNTLEEIAETSVQGWMNSEGHRKNILTETYDRAGMGVAIAEDDRVYITQNFC